MRLSPWRRWFWYLVTAVLVLSGLVWLVADQLKGGEDGETWQRISSSTLMVHGGAAMLALLLMGSLFDVHILRAWRSGRNLTTGIVMMAVNTGLVATAFGLYYSGSDLVRTWTSDAHIAFGLALPLLALVHIWRGRRQRSALPSGFGPHETHVTVPSYPTSDEG